jgi:nucleotidyltransferase-like protein
VVGGSVAHGLARPDSDVDFFLVLDDAEMERRPAVTFADQAVADYEGGYADVKLVTPSFIAEVAERGSEPARWAFRDAFAVWSHDDAIDAALTAAAAYPEAEREQKIRDFVAHAAIAAWYLGEAKKREEPYLTQYAGSHLVLYAGRAVLAHNRMLFPFHKWFMTELERAPERPDRMIELAHALLRAPTTETAAQLVTDVQDFTGVHPTIGESAASFMRRTEWSWRAGGAPFDES